MISWLPAFFAIVAGLSLFAALVLVYQSLYAVFTNTGGIALEDEGSVQRSELLDRKRALLESLHDLRNDHDTKKIEDEDFEQLEAGIRAELREVLRSIDERVARKRDRIEALVRGDGR